jgi:hypothetical protein
LNDLKGKIPSMRNELNDERLFKDFYMFVFEYAKGPEKKVLGSSLFFSFFTPLETTDPLSIPVSPN